jgi:hypothetical protein
MQDGGREARRAEAEAAFEELPTDGSALAARVAGMDRAERETVFPVHSDGQVCR